MALFGRKKSAATPKPDEAPAAVAGVDEESSVELNDAALAPKGGRPGGLLGLVVGVVAMTAVAAGGGVFLGKKAAATIETAIALRDAALAPSVADHAVALKFSGDMVLQPIEAVVTNLAAPDDVWIRLETAMIFRNGEIENPAITAAELRQDILAYLRTVSVARLDGPSALQHLRDDLNERASLRTGGRVGELVIQSLVIQ